MIRDRLNIPYGRQNSYTKNRRKDLEFVIGDDTYLKIHLCKGLWDLVEGQVMSQVCFPLWGFTINFEGFLLVKTT